MFSSHSAKTWELPYDKHMNAILMTKPGFCHMPRRLFDGTCLVQSRSFTTHLKIIVSRINPLIFEINSGNDARKIKHSNPDK